jgi:cell division protease FtsH
MLPDADPLHKVTIVPRGRALGLTQQLPIDEKHTYSRSYLLDSLKVLLGGRVAEELIFNELTTGAGNDIERATSMARKMVCEWGMSEAIGPLTFGKKEEQIFLGREIAHPREYSEATAVKIDEEVTRIVTDTHEAVRELLRDNLDRLKTLAQALLDRETLSNEDIKEILGPPAHAAAEEGGTDDADA